MWLWSVRHKWKIEKIAMAFGRCAITIVCTMTKTTAMMSLSSSSTMTTKTTTATMTHRHCFFNGYNESMPQTHAFNSHKKEQKQRERKKHTSIEKKSSARNFKWEIDIVGPYIKMKMGREHVKHPAMSAKSKGGKVNHSNKEKTRREMNIDKARETQKNDK